MFERPTLGCIGRNHPHRPQASKPTHPFAQALASPAMRERHWRAVMAITGKDLVMAEDVFKLQHLLECNLLAHRWVQLQAMQQRMGQLARR